MRVRTRTGRTGVRVRTRADARHLPAEAAGQPGGRVVMSGDQPDISALFRRSQPLLNALGDPSRQEIIILLLGEPGPTAVNDIAGRVRLSQPAVSHHLRILKKAGIATVERSGKQRLYTLAGPQPFAPLAQLIAAVQSCPIPEG